MLFFDQVAIDSKSVLTIEKRPLVAELKLKLLGNGHSFYNFNITSLNQMESFHDLS